MIHHLSLAVTQTLTVSKIMAQLLGGKRTRFGPNPGSYIVWFGDAYGSALELYPAGTELIPDQGDGQANFVKNSQSSGYTATHAAISVQCSKEEIFACAEQHGWHAIELPRGGFNVVEFWIENKVMLELMTKEMTEDYLKLTQKFRDSL